MSKITLERALVQLVRECDIDVSDWTKLKLEFWIKNDLVNGTCLTKADEFVDELKKCKRYYENKKS